MSMKLRWNSMNCSRASLALVLLLTAPLAAISAEAQTYTVIHTFKGGNDGVEPEAGLLLAANGIYGTTYRGGGDSQTGTVFKIDQTGQETVLERFPGCCGEYPSGSSPLSGLIRDADGNLYGTTYLGGPQYYGTVFELRKNGKLNVLHRFVGTDGSGPSSLIRDAAGNLYGTTRYGGDIENCNVPVGCGTVFKLDTAGKLTVLYVFQGTFDGTVPTGSLALDPQGNLYGIASQGGSFDCQGTGCGTLFKLDSRGKIAILHVFRSSEPYGIFPFGGLIGDQAGNLYGTTNAGAFGDNGAVFKLDPNGDLMVLYDFKGGRDGSGSAAPLIQDAARNFYGTTEFGGDASCKLLGLQLGCGTVFKLDTAGHETVLYRFKGGKDGGFPEAGLVMDAAGKLYGTAPNAGSFGCEEFVGCGVVFKITP
jgi:uncharacterized repeat protein (TIGR03803 family)